MYINKKNEFQTNKKHTEAEVKKEKTVVIAVKLTKMSEQVMTCGKGSNHIWYRDDLFMHSSHDYKFNPFLRFSQSGNNHQLQGLYECRSYDSDLHLISHTSYEVIFTGLSSLNNCTTRYYFKLIRK